MLSSLGSIFDRPFIVGFVLPTVLFAVSALILLPELFEGIDGGAFLLEPSSENVAYAVLCIWITAVFLSMLNTNIYRFLEGYYWPFRESITCLSIQRSSFERLSKEYDELKKLLDQTNESSGEPHNKSRVQLKRAQDVLRHLTSYYPYDEADLLPTRLGNVIRSFERYPNRIYSADGVALWTRVLSVAPAKGIENANEEKSKCDFFINLCAFSVLLAGLSLLIALFHLWSLIGDECTYLDCVSFHTNRGVQSTIVVLPSLLAARVSYNISVSMAEQWGQTVRALYDVSIPKLLLSFGLTSTMDKSSQRSALERISMQAVYAAPAELDEFKVESMPKPHSGKRE